MCLFFAASEAFLGIDFERDLCRPLEPMFYPDPGRYRVWDVGSILDRSPGL